MKSKKSKASSPASPHFSLDVYRYESYRGFLADALAALKNSHARFSLRSVARQCQVSVAYLSMVLSGQRRLTVEQVEPLAKFLCLDSDQWAYFEALVQLDNAKTHEGRARIVQKVSQLKKYRVSQAANAEVFQYLSHWHYIAIRECAALPGFRPDPVWIQKRLHARIERHEIQAALQFLFQFGYLKQDSNGQVIPPDRPIICHDSVYRVALAEYHKQMFAQAMESIDYAQTTERLLLGHSIALGEGDYQEARRVIEKALEEVQRLGSSTPKQGGRVYQIELGLFPLTKKPE